MSKKILILLLAGLSVSFIIFGCVGIYIHSMLRTELFRLSDEFGEKIAEYAWSQSKQETAHSIEMLTVAMASQIDAEMKQIENDAELLSTATSRLLSQPEDYMLRDLDDLLLYEDRSNEPYILFSEDLFAGRPPELEQEIARVANIQDLLVDLHSTYTPYNSGCYIASRKGYFICVETDGGSDEVGKPFDARERVWYQEARETKKAVFSDIYVGTLGDKSVTCAMPYREGEDFAGVVGIGCDISAWYDILVKSVIREGKTCFVLNAKGDVILASSDRDFLAPAALKNNLTQNANEQVASFAKKMTAGEVGVEEINFNGRPVHISYAPMKTTGWSLALLTPHSEMTEFANAIQQYLFDEYISFQETMDQADSRFSAIGILCLLVTLLLLVAASRLLAKKFVEPINELTEGVKEIAAGRLDKKLYIKTGDELQVLAENFNTMTDELKAQMADLEKVTAEKERIATELDVATKIQGSMLPKDFFVDERVDIFATMTPAKEVGGDLYDFYMTDQNHLSITIADVSGKGVPAALFMVAAITNLRNFTTSLRNPEDLKAAMEHTNDRLCANNDGGFFVTTFSAALHLETGKFTYVNAGHNPPLIRRCGKDFEEMPMALNFVLGGWENWQYIEQEIQLEEGDTIFLYTDGVTEAADVTGEMYSVRRLKKILNELEPNLSAQEILNQVSKSLQQFTGDAEQSDDITMLAVKFERSKRK